MAREPRSADPANQADRGDNRVDERPASPAVDSVAQVHAARATLDQNRSSQARAAGLIGPKTKRWDALEKVTGDARYCDDVPARAAHAFMVTSTVARGRIRRIDTRAALAVPGVIRVYTHEDMQGRVKPLAFVGQGGQGITDHIAMSGPKIVHAGQIVAFVVAESFEAAREASFLVRPDIAPRASAATFGDAGVTTRTVRSIDPNWRDPVVGDADRAFASAAHSVKQTYTTPTHHQNPIELPSTTCWWEGGRLIIHEPSAAVHVLRIGVATQLGIARDDVQVISPYVGGSFGAKVNTSGRTALLALAARDLGRPVRCVLTRTQSFTQTTHRAETRHEIRLACDRAGKLTGYGHEAWELSSRTDAYTVKGTETSVAMYGWPNATTRVNVSEADRDTPGFMRAPAEMPYLFALECAMDELAEKAETDPVRFRLLNDVQTVTYEKKRFTSRSLDKCLQAGAAAFGWDRRDPRPRSMRDGDWLVGYGVASGCLPTKFSPTAVRIRIADGTATLEVAAHEIGTGAMGMAATIASQELGLPLDRIRVEMGDTRLPIGPLAASSRSTAVLGNAIADACHRLRVRLGVADGASVVDALHGGAAEELLDWEHPGAAPGALASFYAGGQAPAGGVQGEVLRAAFGAQFVEVRVHRRTCEIRVPRIVGAFAAGRIINATTAHSQLMGGLIWGIGSALHEATDIDRRTARYVNDDLGEYLVPVNADTPSVEVIMIPEDDRDVNALGIKGVGELGIVGSAAAICNAVYHATGKRIRELPVTIEKLF